MTIRGLRLRWTTSEPASAAVSRIRRATPLDQSTWIACGVNQLKARRLLEPLDSIDFETEPHSAQADRTGEVPLEIPQPVEPPTRGTVLDTQTESEGGDSLEGTTLQRCAEPDTIPAVIELQCEAELETVPADIEMANTDRKRHHPDEEKSLMEMMETMMKK